MDICFGTFEYEPSKLVHGNNFWQIEFLNFIAALFLNLCGKFWKSIFIKNTLEAILIRKNTNCCNQFTTFPIVVGEYSISVES
jgi:hypothetical protein